MDLRSILTPVATAEFFERYWEKQPLLVSREDRGYFSTLFSLADLDSVICFTHPCFPNPIKAQGGHTDSSKTYLRGKLPPWFPWDNPLPEQLSLSELARTYREGRTIVIRGMERRWPAIARLCSSLQAELHHTVGANLYVTPPGSQAFVAHYDNHDTFIVQVEGAKHWRVYNSPQQLPLNEPPLSLTPQARAHPELEITLHAGDVLYVPRGFIHEAYTREAHSLHITLGVFGFYWADLLSEAVWAVAERDLELRKLLPPGYLHDESLQTKFDELLHRIVGSSLPEALGRIAERFLKATPVLPAEQFFPEDREVTLDTPLEKLPGLICWVSADGETATIQSQYHQIRGPRHSEAALRHVARSDRFPPGRFPDASAIRRTSCWSATSLPRDCFARRKMVRQPNEISVLTRRLTRATCEFPVALR